MHQRNHGSSLCEEKIELCAVVLYEVNDPVLLNQRGNEAFNHPQLAGLDSEGGGSGRKSRESRLTVITHQPVEKEVTSHHLFPASEFHYSLRERNVGSVDQRHLTKWRLHREQHITSLWPTSL